MGVIKQQGINHSIISLIGILIGGISTIFIYPKDLAFNGLLNTLLPAANLLLPFLSLGATSLVIRYFPLFKNKEKGHHGFLGLMLLLPAAGILLMSGVGFWVLPFIAKYLSLIGFKLHIFETYKWQILLLGILLIYIQVLTYYVSNFGKIVLPNILNNLVLKLLLPTLVLLHLSGIASPKLIYSMVIAYLVLLLVLVSYTFHLGAWHIRFNFQLLTPTLQREMGVYAIFGLLGAMGTTLTQQIDTLMITSLVGEQQSGSFIFFAFIANTIQFPMVALASISSPIIAQHLQENNLQEVHNIYQQSSINALIIGILLYIGVSCNLNDLVHLTSNADALLPLTSVFLFLGLARLFDTATSLNSQIIVYSKYFKFNLFILLFLAITNIIGNYLFIQVLDFGALGAAIATCISMFLYNLIKLLFIWFKFKMLPFTSATFGLLGIGFLVAAIAYYIPFSDNHLLNLLLKSTTILLLYLGLVYYFRISKDFNALLLQYFSKLKLGK